jgi:hypothetical protein
MKLLIWLSSILFLSAPIAFAGTVAYTGASDEKLFIQEATKLGKNVFLIKFQGIESKWSDKVIKTTRTTSPIGDRYSFEYNLELSSGVQKKSYQIVVSNGYELKNGSRVPKIQLFTQEMPNQKPYELDYDGALTKASGADLISEYNKSPFVPDVD